MSNMDQFFVEFTLFSKANVILIYGFNNSGKTFFLKKLINYIYDKNQEILMLKNNQPLIKGYYLSTNRLESIEKGIKPEELKQISPQYIDTLKEMVEKVPIEYISSLRVSILDNELFKSIIQDALLFLFDEDLEIDELVSKHYSDGVQNIVNIYCAIFKMLTIYNSELNNKDDIKNAQGLLLVDEIEMYLHIKVQVKLLTKLINDFPKIRFIFTTHSPVLISRAKNAEIYSIDNMNLELIENNYFYESIDIVTENLFDVSQYPKEFNSFISYLNRLLQKEQDFNQEEYLEYLKNIEQQYPHLILRLNNTKLDFCKRYF